MTHVVSRRFSMIHALAVLALVPSLTLAQGSALLSAADSASIELLVYTTALMNGTRTAHASTAPELVCVSGMSKATDPKPWVIDSLQRGRALLVRPISACGREPLQVGQRSRSLVFDSLTQKRGISISATFLYIEADGTLWFETGYYQHGLSSAAWRCSARRRGDQWEVVGCTMLWIS